MVFLLVVLKILHDLEDKRFIKIVKSPGFASPALPGKEMELAAFEVTKKLSDDESSLL